MSYERGVGLGTTFFTKTSLTSTSDPAPSLSIDASKSLLLTQQAEEIAKTAAIDASTSLFPTKTSDAGLVDAAKSLLIAKATVPDGSSNLATGKIDLSIGGTTSQDAPLPNSSYVRVPTVDRPGLKVWYQRWKGRTSASYQNWLTRDPGFSAAEKVIYDLYKDAKARCSAMSKKPSIYCLTGDRAQIALRVLRWWEKCDVLSWAAWTTAVLPHVKVDPCVSIPGVLYDHYLPYDRVGSQPGCPSGSVKDQLFSYADVAKTGTISDAVDKAISTIGNTVDKTVDTFRTIVTGKTDGADSSAALQSAHDAAVAAAAAAQAEVDRMQATIAQLQRDATRATNTAELDALRAEMARLQLLVDSQPQPPLPPVEFVTVNPATEPSFFDRNRVPIIIGGVALAGLGVYWLVKRR